MQARVVQEFFPESAQGPAKRHVEEARPSSSSLNAEGFPKWCDHSRYQNPMKYAFTHAQFTSSFPDILWRKGPHLYAVTERETSAMGWRLFINFPQADRKDSSQPFRSRTCPSANSSPALPCACCRYCPCTYLLVFNYLLMLLCPRRLTASTNSMSDHQLCFYAFSVAKNSIFP